MNDHTTRVVRALQSASGNITIAAKQLKINERTLRRWLAHDPELRAALQQILAKLAHTLPLTRAS
jgi:hypothetical protein